LHKIQCAEFKEFIDLILGMINIDQIQPGNLLELFIEGGKTEFLNDNSALSRSLGALGIRVSRGIQKVVSIENGKINGLPAENFESIFAYDNEWLTRLKGIPSDGNKIQIGRLKFHRTDIGLLLCDDDFNRISDTKIMRYMHQIQNLHKEKTGEELQYDLN
jgi:hypothetical protein